MLQPLTKHTAVWHTNTAKSQTVFDWFSTIKYWLHHQNMCKDIHIDSGKWLLSKEEFASWVSSLQSSVLWLHGIPGSGKSKLVAQVIDHMKSKIDQSTGTLAYFYCLRDIAEDERSRPEEVIRSILRQLSFKGKNPKVLKEPAALHYQKKVDEAEEYGTDVIDRLTWEECIALLISLLEGSTTVIIIDAIDELKKEERWMLYEAFDRILDHPGQRLVRIFVSSRDAGDIVMKLSAYRNVYISATDNQADIERFVKFEVQKAISCHRLLRGSVPDSLKGDIVATLIKGAQGM
jgi:nucleoside-triphosphatase THEP1